jgi:hypothetical protein
MQQNSQHQCAKRRRKIKKRRRLRAMPSPDAYSFTIPDAQAMGAPSKTTIYGIDKRLKAEGKALLFKDAAGRTMMYGNMLRALFGGACESVETA